MNKRHVRGFEGAPLDVSTWSDPKPASSEPPPRYRCPEDGCGWEGTEAEMEADFTGFNSEGDEMWSNWICPRCHTWWQLEDYTRLP